MVRLKQNIMIEEIDKTISALHKVKDELEKNTINVIKVKQLTLFAKSYANQIGRNGL